MSISILDLLKQRTVLLDGAMGTELMKAGLGQGECLDAWNIDRPEAVQDIQRRYFEAGSDAVVTNTFGANPIKLAAFGLQDRCREFNLAAVRLVQEVRPEGRFIGGDIGPTGKFLKPMGEFEESQFEEAFLAQASALAEAGVDFFIIETMYDLREALCAVRACLKASPLPVFASLTFNRTPRGFFTIMGDSPAKGLKAMEQAGAVAVGANCTLDSEAMADLVKIMRPETSLPLIAQPNAGQPEIGAGREATYSQDPENYVRHLVRSIEYGAQVVGGCCGTDPDIIRRLAEVIIKS
jgi:5-methyltetrahydrofolate--homocysteine methyltransferase